MQRGLFKLLRRFSDRYGAIMGQEQLEDLMRAKFDVGTRAMYAETYAALAGSPCPEWHEYQHSTDMLRQLAGERATGEALATGKAILAGLVRLEDGTELRGPDDAREFVLGALAEAQLLSTDSETAEGDISAEGGDVLAAYAEARALRDSGKPVGVQVGIESVDKGLAGGIKKGLTLVVGSTGSGKSTFCVQVAWHNAVMEGRNVQYFTTEQARDEVRAKIVARHSCLPQFGLQHGLDSSRILSGWLRRGEEQVLADVVADLKGGGYGQIQTVQMPDNCTVSMMRTRSEGLARAARPDVLVMDYLQLLAPERKTRDSRVHEDQSGIVKTAHSWALTAYRQTGVSLISPWQANQAGATALRGGQERFSVDTHMSATKEAGNTAGMVLALGLREEDTTKGRAVPLKLSVVKHRGGAAGESFDLTADYATSRFSEHGSAGGGDEDYLDDGEA